MSRSGGWKARLRAGVAMGVRRSGWLAAAERASRASLTVLCYHRILPTMQRDAYHDPGLVVTPEVFDRHCRIMAERYTVAPLEVALMRWSGGERPRKPLAAITFDDGYRDNARYAAPILEEHALRGTFFVIAGLVDTDQVPWYDAAGAAWNMLARTGDLPKNAGTARQALERAKQMPPRERIAWVRELVHRSGFVSMEEEDLIMSSQQIRELAAAGHEIGSHSMTHPILPQCDQQSLQHEIAESRARLVAISGQTVRGLCYPNGDYDTRCHTLAVRSGYTYATTMLPGLNLPYSFDTLSIRRWFIEQDRLSDASGHPSEALFRMEVCGMAQRVFRRGAA